MDLKNKNTSNLNNKPIMDLDIIFGKYKLVKKLGEGAFGQAYMAINIHTNEKFAVKIESQFKQYSLLKDESQILLYLRGEEGVPQISVYGNSNYYNILVMELLGPNLEKLYKICEKRFSIKTVCLIGEQIVNYI